MKNLQFPVLLDPSFCSREQKIDYNGKILTVTTTKKREIVDEFVFDTCNYLMCEKNQEIAKCQIAVVDGNPDYNKKLQGIGFKVVPKNFIWLTKIGMLDLDLKNQGFASALLNIVVYDIQETSEFLGQTLPILFSRINSAETRAFYSKFEAHENVAFFRYTSYSPMIIENPKINTKNNPKILETSFSGIQREKE